MSTPNSLVSRLLKARYYLHTSFLEARLGNNPSFVLRSVWMAKSVIASGIRRRIGNRERINMWKDLWIKDNPNFKPTTQVIDIMEDLKVATLWSHEMHCWNEDLLKELLNDQDVKAISNMLLPYTTTIDKLIWNFTKDRRYSMKSGYRVAYKLNQLGSRVELREGPHKIW